MTIQEYKTYYDQHLQKKVEKYMRNRYGSGKYLLCWFYLNYIDFKRKNRVTEHPWKVELDKEDYVTLLAVVLKHPEITFQEMPRFIPLKLYEYLLLGLRFPTTTHTSRPDEPGPRSNPVGIEMASLQDDAKPIAGDEPYSFLLYSYTPKYENENLSVSIWMKQMEVRVSYTVNNLEQMAIYGMIDVETVKKVLRVKTYKGIESALCRYVNKSSNELSDVFWLIRWLDNYGIKYVHAEDKSMNI